MYSTEEYLKQHPDSSLADYVSYVQKVVEEEAQSKRERADNRDQWYKNLTGKYFVIDFNRVSFIVIHIKTPININAITTNYHVYDVYCDSYKNEYSIKEEIRPVNKYWFNNPYESRDQIKTIKVKEVTKEFYDNIKERLNTIREIFEDFNLKG